MILNKLVLKNFGRFSGKEITLKEGINIIYGDNESGKSTIHTFIQGIFFGMRRMRGKASRTDDYTHYTPWENPGWYEGAVTFTCAGKRFCLERNFAAGAKGTRLYCESDGELLSVEDGDLEMLLGGISEVIYRNTVSAGQLRSRTEEGLLLEIRDYLTSCQGSGDVRINPERALEILKSRRKLWEKKQEELSERRRQEEGKLRTSMEYQSREAEKLREKIREYAQAESAAKKAAAQVRHRIQREKEKERETEKKDRKKTRKSSIQFLRICLYAFVTVLAGAGVLLGKCPLIAVAVILAAEIMVETILRFREKKGRRSLPKEKMGADRGKEEAEELAARAQRLSAQLEIFREQLEERQTELSNLKEEYDEFAGNYEEVFAVKKEIDSITLAEKRIRELSVKMKNSTGGALREKMSEILSGITGGRYKKVVIDEDFNISLYTGEKLVPLYQLSSGTVEQVYLALRMASAEILCREEELPVLLDETLAFYDDKRLLETLLWLGHRKTQVILFSCTRREIEALRGKGIPCSVIEL